MEAKGISRPSLSITRSSGRGATGKIDIICVTVQ